MKISQIVRSLFRDRLNTIVIMISLAVGMACINLLLLFINNELKTDSFHKNGDRIYLLQCDNPFDKGTRMSSCRIGGAEYMKNNLAQVEDICRINYLGAQKVIVNGQTYSEKTAVYGASGNFFNFFSFNLIAGNQNLVLETKSDIVISEELAVKYYGYSDPVGKMITLISGKNTNDYIIKGVFRQPSTNTQFKLDMVTLQQESERFAYILLKEKSNPADLEKIFAEEKDNIPSINDGTPGQYYLKSLKQAYFDTTQESTVGSVRDKSDLMIALVIGMMILGIASFNYLGLLSNKLLNKTTEFHIRRLNGSSKTSMIAGFMAENIIIITIAFIISLKIMDWMIPYFNGLTATDISFSHIFQRDGLYIISGVFFFLLLLTLFFSITKIDYNNTSTGLKALVNTQGKARQIPAFNITQLAVSLVLLTCSIVIIKQMNYITNKDIGLDKEVIEIKVPIQYPGKASVFKDEILNEPSIAHISITTASPLLEYMIFLLHYTEDGVEKEYTPAIFRGDENFIETLDIKLLEGRNFSGIKASNNNNCLINESLARKFPGHSLIGEKLPGYDELTIIGVVKDFHYYTLKSVIGPGVIKYDNTGNHLLVKASKNMLPAARKKISETWTKLIPDYPVNIESVRDRYEWYHRENSNYVKFIGSCCLISLFLSMIGLFAISYNSSIKRTKEIGIRKINGATITGVMSLLSKGFLKWVVVAFIIATPLSWYIMNKWLQNFAYKTSLSWWIFALAGLLALGVALITVSWQSWRAATRNPVEALRYE